MTNEIAHPAPVQQESYPKLGDDLIQFFAYQHLPQHLQMVSMPFASLAEVVVSSLPRCAERTVCLRKLLEAKDAAVRTKLWKPAS